ncbi:MAG: excinuclease ABC subunit UvrA [Betaproteobacteria bacterium]|nr:MAG: excinuclease ABC subunit UvrA [Betaproteobacteria bacterium]
MDFLRVRGARTHNLKNINLDIPKHKLVVITGLSGSGKSSLAFDTLYAEGQRRYVESLSAYARQFLQLTDKPDVDLIEGLSPAIAIEQKATSHNPRSTVGTVTEIHDYLRLLYARVGDPYCPNHPHIKLEAQTISQMVDALLALPSDTRVMLLAPAISERKGEHVELLIELKAKGFTKVRVDGDVVELDPLPKLAKTTKHTIEVVVDRVKIRADQKQRLAESFETACNLGGGRALAVDMDSGKSTLFSSKFACPICDYSLAELEPRLFSFNSPMGACPTCDGLGAVDEFEASRIVSHPELSLAGGAIRGWDRRTIYYFQLVQALAAHYKFDVEKPWNELSQKARDVVLFGSGDEAIEFAYVSEKGFEQKRKHPFEGVIPNFKRRYRETESSMVREELAKYMSRSGCPDCGGARIKREARFVKVGDGKQSRAIYELSALPLHESAAYFEALKLDGAKKKIAERIVWEIKSRVGFLNNVGLEYLSLDRSAETLSGGEAQRICLASQIGSGLTGVMYVLDEPSIGLHQRDNDRLLATLKHLRDLGNTVLVVEHDEDAIMSADYVIDLGPAAGVHGGEIVAQGKPSDIKKSAKSLTGLYLSGKKQIALPKKRIAPNKKKQITVRGARGNNLKNVDVSFPVGLLTCVTGVSGSGKSTLVNDTLFRAAAKKIYSSVDEPAAHKSMTGLEHFDKVIDVDQSPIGRTPRSNPATYTGLFTPIRELFAQTPQARERGYEPGRFSFNVKGGRCEACEGDGVIKVEMHFLPDVYVLCDVCHGKRYNRETLDIQYRGKNISEVLELTVEDAKAFFSAVPTVAQKVNLLDEVGLGYVKLGQAATTLSGGEAQRVKLALELSKRDTGNTLYILDEPTTGLHFADIDLLMKVIYRLRDHGNTVVVIEHNLDVIKTADWIIDMGPEGGDGGGTVVVEGTPETVASEAKSYTGRYLRELLSRKMK